MQDRVQHIRAFLYSQAFADGFRATLAILLPALIGNFTGHFDEGLTISLGAMCVSLTDAPGPILHKRNGMLFCVLFIFLTAILTSWLRTDLYLMTLGVAVITFFFSMFNVYGNRASAVGNAAILIMILTMDKPIAVQDAFSHAALIVAGGTWYLILSLMLYAIRPYRNAERALADSIRQIAHYLDIRARFYNPGTELESNYRQLIAQQVVVQEKQDAVREIFFKTRQIVQESSEIGRRLVFTFVETVDLFEDITAAYYDYAGLRATFSSTGALEPIHKALRKVVMELHDIAFAMQVQARFTPGFDYDEEIRKLKAEIDQLSAQHPSQRVLHRIIVNIRNLLTDINRIAQYFDDDVKRPRSNVDHSHFVSHQSLDPTLALNNFTLQSSVFRHAIRVAAASTIGFIIAKVWNYGHHSYWILLTIAFILKPAFSLTKQRNIERIIGTFAGGVVGVLLLLFIPHKQVLFAFMVLFMLGTYTFLRINYLWMVICTTPYVLILFSFFGIGFRELFGERVMDTLIGCGIAFLASYLLFPKWEAEELKQHMQGIVKANARYLSIVIQLLQGKRPETLEYKLARKEVYLTSANLSASFQRMLSEPRNKQQYAAQMHQFVVLNHILFSNIATVATRLLSKEAKTYDPALAQLARKALMKMRDSSELLGRTIEEPVADNAISSGAEDRQVLEQLEFIYTVSRDIAKLSVFFSGQSATAKPVHSLSVPTR